MRFKGLDLNLLVALEALIETRSVSRAAERLHLTQPAMSSALARLRSFFSDELLTSHNRRMHPTAHAETLMPHVREVLRVAASVIDTSRQFDPATSRRTFRIVASDYVVTAVLAPLVRQVRAVAPGVDIDLGLPDERSSERLNAAAVDLVVTPEPYVSSEMPAEFLFEERYVVVGRAGHPALSTSLTEQGFTAAGHVVVGIGEARVPSFGDRHLDTLGVRRRVEVTAPTFTVVPWLLHDSDWLALMHERLARAVSRHLPLAVAPCPFPIPPLREMAQFHPARSSDPGLRWLLDLIQKGVG